MWSTPENKLNYPSNDRAERHSIVISTWRMSDITGWFFGDATDSEKLISVGEHQYHRLKWKPLLNFFSYTDSTDFTDFSRDKYFKNPRYSVNPLQKKSGEIIHGKKK